MIVGMRLIKKEVKITFPPLYIRTMLHKNINLEHLPTAEYPHYCECKDKYYENDVKRWAYY